MRRLALITISCLVAAAAEPWQIRYGHLPDQAAAWTAMGRLPGWTVTQTAGSDEVALGGDQAGACRGVVFLGRPWVVPAGRAVQVRLEYQTYCAVGTATMTRSGQVQLMAFAPAARAALIGHLRSRSTPVLPPAPAAASAAATRQADALAAEARQADGTRDLFAAGSGPGVRLNLPGFGETQAALTLVRLAPAGTVERCFVLP